MIKRMLIMLVLAALVFGGVFGFGVFRAQMIKQYMTAGGIPAQTVSTTPATLQEWQPGFSAVGSLRAAKGVDLAAEIAGIVDSIHFNSGQEIAAGELLLQLRATDDIARLEALKAAAKLAETTYERNKKQVAVETMARAKLDTDAANVQSANAAVTEQEANIEKKSIYAPFGGQLGLRAVDLGQYLTPGTVIVTLQALAPLYLDFHLPQQALAQIKAGQKIRLQSDVYPGKNFEGEIQAINPKVDTATRNVLVRAIIANNDHKLLPGMYATAKIDTGMPERHITLPQTAISYNPYGNTVYIIEDQGRDEQGKPKLTARQRFVTTGETRGDQVAVLSGLKAGDMVVTSGQIKLQNGSPVIVDNSIQPSNDIHPTPSEQ